MAIEPMILEAARQRYGVGIDIAEDPLSCQTRIRRLYNSPVRFRKDLGRTEIESELRQYVNSVSDSARYQVKIDIMKYAIDEIDHLIEDELILKSKEAKVAISDCTVECRGDMTMEGFAITTAKIEAGTAINDIANGLSEFNTRHGTVRGRIIQMNTNTRADMIRDLQTATTRWELPSQGYSVLGTSVFVNESLEDGAAVITEMPGETNIWHNFEAYQGYMHNRINEAFGIPSSDMGSIHAGEDKAVELLKGLVHEIDLRNYQSKGYIDVKAESGAIYRIWKTKMIDVFTPDRLRPQFNKHPEGDNFSRLFLNRCRPVEPSRDPNNRVENHKLIGRLCIHPPRNLNLPPTDEVISKILLARTNENKLLEVAHCFK